MTLTSGMAKLNLAIFICFISETFPHRFLDAANICTNRLQLVLRHNDSPILCLLTAATVLTAILTQFSNMALLEPVFYDLVVALQCMLFLN